MNTRWHAVETSSLSCWSLSCTTLLHWQYGCHNPMNRSIRGRCAHSGRVTCKLSTCITDDSCNTGSAYTGHVVNDRIAKAASWVLLLLNSVHTLAEDLGSILKGFEFHSFPPHWTHQVVIQTLIHSTPNPLSAYAIGDYAQGCHMPFENQQMQQKCLGLAQPLSFDLYSELVLWYSFVLWTRIVLVLKCNYFPATHTKHCFGFL